MKSERKHTTGTIRADARRRPPRRALWTSLAVIFFAFAGTAQTVSGNTARDPFWPLGYTPPRPEPEQPSAEPEPETPKPPPEPEKPALLPITPLEWDEARKTLSVSGQIRSTRPDTGETRAQMMINRQTYGAGDKICVTNRGAIFVWQLTASGTQDLRFEQVEAVRLHPDTKQAAK